MDVFDFLGFNVVMVGIVLLIVLVYLIFLINKRRKNKFLHRDTKL